jgi:hypothetical protein
MPLTKNPVGDATGWQASLTLMGYAQSELLNTLCLDNGGNSGAGYWQFGVRWRSLAFARQL